MRIKELRVEKDITQIEFAKIMGVAQNTLSNWENGNRQPDNEYLIKMADYFSVSIDYLLGRGDEPLSEEEKELNEYLEELKNRQDMRMLFKLAKGATKADVEKAVRIIEALKDNQE